MRIDLNKIPMDRPCAVHVPTKEAARAFYKAMLTLHRDKVRTDGMIFFDQYDRESGFCYYPRFHERRQMTYGRRSTYDDWGVPVLEFESLEMDDLSIAVSEMPIESLFG